MAGSGNVVTTFTINGNSKSLVAAANQAATALNKLNTQVNKMSSKTTNTNVGGGAANNGLPNQKDAVAQATKLGNQIGSAINSAYSKMVQGGMGMVNAFRFAMQGVSELSRVMTTMISIPMLAFLGAGAKGAIDFESAMVRVSKTTGVTGQKLENLRSWIREFSKSTVSSNTELATFAEQLGQLGVYETKPMEMMVRTVEMMASATDLSADDVTKAIGRIGTAFGYDLNTEAGATNIHKLANTINYLENTTAAAAGEIVDGLLNVASVGGMLKIPVQDMAAIVAMMESMGVSADAVGNRLARWYQQIIQKSDKAAKLMQGFTTTTMSGDKRTYSGSGDELLKWVNEDKAQVLMDFSTAMSQVNDESRTTALKDWFGVFGQVGAKVGVLSGNIPSFTEALRGARKEFESGNSLFSEYDKALLTTDAHLKILRNNVQDVGVTLGDAFLPIINRIIEYAIPAVRMLTMAFKNLTWENKLLVVGIPLLVTVLAPVLFILSQLGHAVGMMGMGFFSFLGAIGKFGGAIFSLFKVVSSVVTLFGTLGTAGAAVGGIFSGLGPILMTLVGAVVSLGVTLAAFAGIGAIVGKSLQTMGVDVAGFFTRLAQAAKSWGENMMATYAGGLLGGAAQFISKSLSAIATMIAKFFEAHSPPKEGPLSTIDKWGGPLFTTYLRGFYTADFGILSDIGGMIKSALEMMFKGNKDEKDSVVAAALSAARVQLARFIEEFNKTGQISEGVLSGIVNGTGILANDFKTLIRLSVQYEASQRRLKDLEKQREEVNKSYSDQVASIAGASLTAEEKASRIRSAIYSRNNSLDAIDKEKTAEEEKSNVLKDQLDWQKEYIKAQLDQASVIDSVKAAVSGLGSEISALDFGGAATKVADSVTGAFDNFTTTIQERIQSAKDAIDAFLLGLSGKPMDNNAINIGVQEGTLPPDQFAEMSKAYDLGNKIYTVVNNIKLIFEGKMSILPPLLSPEDEGKFNDLQTKFDEFKAKIEGVGQLAGAFGSGFSEGLAPFLDIVGKILEFLSKGKMGQFVDWLTGKSDSPISLKDAVADLHAVGDMLGAIAGFFGMIATVIVTLPQLVGTAINKIGKKLGGIFGKIGTDYNDAGGVGGIFTSMFTQGSNVPPGGPVPVQETTIGAPKPPQTTIGAPDPNMRYQNQNLWDTSGLRPENIQTNGINDKAIGDALQPLWTGISNFFNSVITPGVAAEWQKFAQSPVTYLTGWWDTTVTPLFIGLWTGISGWFTGTALPWIGQQWTAFQQGPVLALTGWWETNISPLFGQVWTGITTWFTDNTTLIATKWNSFRDTFVTSFNELPAKVATAFTSLFFKPEVVEALKGLSGQFYNKGVDLISSMKLGIDSISGTVVGAITGIVNKVVAEVERGLQALGRLAGIGGGGGAPTVGHNNDGSVDHDNNPATPFAKGGIVYGPTHALIGEAGTEVVAPLSRLPMLLNKAAALNNYAEQAVNVQINNPVVRSDQDLMRLTKRVKDSVRSGIRDTKRYKGK